MRGGVRDVKRVLMTTIQSPGCGAIRRTVSELDKRGIEICLAPWGLFPLRSRERRSGSSNGAFESGI
jgi:hypothetical protein